MMLLLSSPHYIHTHIMYFAITKKHSYIYMSATFIINCTPTDSPSLRVNSIEPILETNDDNITLTCFARGTLPATISWMKDDDSVLIDNKNTLLSQSLVNRVEYRYSYTLTIRDTTTSLIGAYSCNYRNRYGSSDRSQRSVRVEGNVQKYFCCLITTITMYF